MRRGGAPVSTLPVGGSSKFVDNIFPPDISSLCFDPYSNKMDPDVKEFVSQVKSWRRPTEWCKEPQLFKDDACPGDIEQGQLGDCWLLSALGVVSVRPQILKHLFVKADVKRGEYCVRLYHEGRWEEVNIDDRIPCGSNGLPVFAHCVDSEEIWVPILEKAMAKLLGTYEALDGGYLEEGVVMLTGGRPEKVTVNNWKGKGAFEETAADLWHKLLTYCQEGHMMGAAICSGKELPDKSTGLVAGHAYGIMNVVETSDKKFKLVQLRNPWGSFEWKGRWSDGSREWTKQYIAETGMTNVDDGTFWMELSDFRKYYDKITVCRIFNLRLLTFDSPLVTAEDKIMFGNVDWNRVKFECEWNDTNAGGILNAATYGQNPHLKLDITQHGKVFFLISQPALTTQAESRYYRTGIGFAVQKGSVDKKGMVRLPSQTDDTVFMQAAVRNRYNSAHLVVTPGPYVIIPFTDYPNRKTKFVFEIYSEKPFEASVLLPEDKLACRNVPASARGTRDGASAAPTQSMAKMSISSPVAERASAPRRVDAIPTDISQARRVAPSPTQYDRSTPMSRSAHNPTTTKTLTFDDSSYAPRSTSTISAGRSGGAPASPNRPPAGATRSPSSRASGVASAMRDDRFMPSHSTKDDRYMTTTKMNYK